MSTAYRNTVLVGSAHEAAATVVRGLLASNEICHVTSSTTLWQTLNTDSDLVGLVIIEEAMWAKNFATAITRVRKTYGLPVVAVLSNATPQSMGRAILAGACGIVRGPILDSHGIMDAVNDALLAY